MKHVMSNELRNRLADWYDWATNKNGKGISAAGIMYSNRRGLCSAVCKGSEYGLASEFDNILTAEFGNVTFPFGGSNVYLCDSITQTQHQNTQRLEWVREQLGITV